MSSSNKDIEIGAPHRRSKTGEPPGQPRGDKRLRTRGKRSATAELLRKAARSERRRIGRQLSRKLRSPLDMMRADGESSATNSNHYPKRINNSLITLQTNVNGLRTRFPVIVKIAEEFQPTVIAACETKIDDSVPDSKIAINNFSLAARKDRNSCGGGVCLWIRDGVDFIAQNIESEFEIVAVIINTNAGQILVASCYAPPSCNHANFFEFTSRYLAGVLSSVTGVILLGDFNAASGSAAIALSSMLRTNSIRSHNTTATRDGRCLDLVLSDFDSSRVNCKVLPAISDHSPVVSTFDAGLVVHKPVKRQVFDFSRAKWNELRRYLGSLNWSQIFGHKSIDRCAVILKKCIIEAVRKYIPKKYINTRSSTLPWWDNVCEQALRNRLANAGSNDSLQQSILSAQTRYRKKIRDSLSNKTMSQSQWWSTVGKSTGFGKCSVGIPSLTGTDGVVIHDPKSKCETFASLFASRAPPVVCYEDVQLPTPCLASLSFVAIRRREVSKELFSLDSSKACGSDNISPRVVRPCALQL
jgi:hypothetical protein